MKINDLLAKDYQIDPETHEGYLVFFDVAVDSILSMDTSQIQVYTDTDELVETTAGPFVGTRLTLHLQTEDKTAVLTIGPDKSVEERAEVQELKQQLKAKEEEITQLKSAATAIHSELKSLRSSVSTQTKII